MASKRRYHVKKKTQRKRIQGKHTPTTNGGIDIET
jgi:hypothetical protein